MKKFLILIAILLGINTATKACSPYATPTLISQTIVGNNLSLQWQSFTAWTDCSYKIFVQVACIGTPFTANADSSNWDFQINEGDFLLNAPLPYFFISDTIYKSQNVQMYPGPQLIPFASLCPGRVYKFRAMEVGADGNNDYFPGISVQGSYWTPTFTFMVPGQITQPNIIPIPTQSIFCAGNTTLTALVSNSCGPGPLTYSWIPATGLSCNTCSNPLCSPTVNTTYSLVVTGGDMGCWTASTTVQVVLASSNASILSTATMVGCTNTISVVSLTTVGSASVPISITWQPPPGSISGNSLVATNLAVGITTITVVDAFGCTITKTIAVLPAPPPITFTINNLSGSFSITCSNPSVNLQAISNYTYGVLSYSWTSISFTANTSSVTITQPMNVTVTATDPATGCFTTQVIAIGINTTAPTASVSPSSQAITCAAVTPITFTGTISNPTVNTQMDWYSPINPLPGGVPIATSNNSVSLLSGIIPPGVYTLVSTNLVNGCKSYNTVTVTSLNAWPTYSLASPTNFSTGCNPINCTTISIINPISTQTPVAGVCSYTFLAPSFTGVISPTVVFGSNTSTTTCTPGTWTVIVQDNSNFCRTTISVPILQNTIAPNVSATVAPFSYTLTCYNPTLLATGSSTTPNTTVSWLVPSIPPALSQPTVVIGDPANGPNTSTTSLTYANFTVVATNSLNACQSTSVLIINQNFKKPISSPTISIATPTAIYCTAATAPAVLTTGNSTTTSGGGPTAYVANPCWAGPSPQTSTCGPSSYSCYVPGIYTLTVMDNYNGCINTGTVNVLDQTQPPVLAAQTVSTTLDCASNTATLIFQAIGPVNGFKYLIKSHPSGVAFSPTNAITPPGISGTFVIVNKVGHYTYLVTNTLTGCTAQGGFQVTNGTLNAAFTPDPETGYAPLNVNFTNNSSSNTSGTISPTASITSVWSFGNGTSQTTTSTINTSALYQSPGTYTVYMTSIKGSCKDTAIRIIRVDIPSKLEIPNIFTPNGDGSNDVFFVKGANLQEIDIFIMDRWGNKVYETKSTTGNIAWDGKNFSGKDCADGVYLYVLKAKGKDDVSYDRKGNVTLLR